MNYENLELFLSSPIPSSSTRKISFRISKEDYENLKFLSLRSKTGTPVFASQLFSMALSESVLVAKKLDSFNLDTTSDLFDSNDSTFVEKEVVPPVSSIK
jgi:hypothetical protein